MTLAARSALIGYTGFVGGNLLSAAPWTDCYNSKNIETLAGRSYDLVVCAGVSAVKWKANKDPQGDWAGIQPLLDALAQVRAKRFVLISTIDVYPLPVLVDEDCAPDAQTCHPYGSHRFKIEQFVRQHFENALIVRLPGMFGPGLRKNAIYDLLTNNQVELVDPDACFQFYHVGWTWADIERAGQLGLNLLNLSTEPVSMQQVAQQAFGRTLPTREQAHPRYDFRSKHASSWGGRDGYLYEAAQVLAAMSAWVQVERASGGGNPCA